METLMLAEKGDVTYFMEDLDEISKWSRMSEMIILTASDT